ncbi:MAG: LemA family protein, partial [Patescibacteria group bacterium]
MKKSTKIILAVVVIVLLYGFVSYNGLVTLNESADAQWAQVETQYQRRLDLIPNLVNSVKGVMTQEQKIFGDLADARAKYANAGTPNEKASAASQVETSFGRLLAIMENYPQLNSSQNVQDLMAQLEGTENRVSVERNR